MSLPRVHAMSTGLCCDGGKETRTDGRRIDGAIRLHVLDKGNTYCFSSADAKSQFMKNPSGNLTKAESFYKSEHKG